MNSATSNWASPALLTLVALVELSVGIALSQRHLLALQTIVVMIVGFLVAVLLLWLKWPRARHVLGVSFVTILCGFATAGNLLTRHFAAGLGFGSIFLLGVFLTFRHFVRPGGTMIS